MIDTLILSLSKPIILPSLISCKPGETFQFHDFSVEISSIKSKSPFGKLGWTMYLDFHDPITKIHISGPARLTPAGLLFLPHLIRLNIPRLAGLPSGCLPTEQEINYAIKCAVESLHWLPADWLQMAKVRQVDLAMNWALDPVEMLELHQHMRHARVNKDPFKSDPEHGSLYWQGSQLTVCLYNKSRQLNENAAKRYHDVTIRHAPFTRLEFRLQHQAATRCLHHAIKHVPLPPIPGIPPLPAPVLGDFSVHDINEATLFAMYRHLLSDFPDLPRRSIKRLTTQELVAIGIQEQWAFRDGRTILDYYREHAEAKDVRYAQKLSLELDVSRPLFRWLEVVPADDWGPLAMPFVKPLPQPLAGGERSPMGGDRTTRLTNP